MKHSLEDERRALLEQIEASRAVYRRMLSDEPVATAARHLPHQHAAQPSPGAGARAMQWMTDHPLWVAGGVALLVLLAPRVIGAGKKVARRRTHKQHEREFDQMREHEREPRQQGGTLRALLTVAALLLRDPARLRAAARIGQTAWQWMQRRRAAGPPEPPATRTTRTTRLH